MIRFVCTLIALSTACRDAALPRTAVPTFVTPRLASSMQGNAVQMQPGETLTWSVSVRGMRVGMAALSVRSDEGALRIESHFQTIGIADQIRPVRYSLATSLDRPVSEFDDVHRALGRVRAWARKDANPASLKVRHEHRTYLLKLAQPQIDNTLSRPTLRIEGEVRSETNHLIQVTLWLSADKDRLPMQMTLSEDGKQVQARLVDVSES